MRSALPIVLLVTAVALPVSSFAEATLPNHKAGLWESSTEVPGGGETMTSKLCLDANSDELALKQYMENPNSKCKKPAITQAGSRYEVISECVMQGSTVKTVTVLEGDFNSAYTATVNSSFNPPIDGAPTEPVTMAMKWVGPCPAGWNPGDVEVHGMKMSAAQMGAAAKQAADMMDNPEFQKAMQQAKKAMGTGN
jgi:hypothetical protein